jgi:hypothetical protein
MEYNPYVVPEILLIQKTPPVRVFNIKPFSPRQHGLIVAHTNSYASNLYARWGCDTILVATSTAIGTGQANTTAILNKCNDEGIAARICDQYSVTVDGVTYDDWFLPSKDELNQIYLQRLYINYLNQEFYWSSSELNVPNVWTQKLDYGGQTWNSKAYPNYFRPIRTF